jgi:hypothetical protein
MPRRLKSRSTSVLQAKKEEAWEAAKRAGEGGDKRSDRGYLDATKAVGECPLLKDVCCTMDLCCRCCRFAAADVVGSCAQEVARRKQCASCVCNFTDPRSEGVLCTCLGADTKLAEELTHAGEKTAQYAKKTPEETTTTTTKKVDSHYVS